MNNQEQQPGNISPENSQSPEKEYVDKQKFLHKNALILEVIKNTDIKLLVGHTKIELLSDDEGGFFKVTCDKPGQEIDTIVRIDSEALINGQELVFGRDDINPNDMTISREHFSLKYFDQGDLEGQFKIEDSSTNGTTVKYKKQVN